MSIAGSLRSIQSPRQHQPQASANAGDVLMQLGAAQCELTVSAWIVHPCDDPCDCQPLLCTFVELKIASPALMIRCSCCSLQS